MNPADIAAFIRAQTGARTVQIDGLERLTGGAIQENFGFIAIIDGAAHEFVLRTEARSKVPESHSIAEQFALMRAAHAAGVPIAEPLWLNTAAPYFIVRRLAGSAIGARMVRDGAKPALAIELARALARIHSIVPPRAGLGFLPLPRYPARDAVALYRGYLDREPDPHPALEWGLRALDRRAPISRDIVLCHRDFRTGNYMADGDRLTGVLDWEFAGWGDPHEDIGWFCAKCWRFGAVALEAGGIAERETFIHAYEAASGRAIDRAQVRTWELMAHVRWAMIALHQTARRLAEPSLELALIGRRLPELEYEVLQLAG
ncbi:MAG TPA: phosphotransferase family protein [Alphaproteobacteria bacterium]